MDYVYSVAAALAAYLIGSLSFAVIVSRLMGLNDPRSYGSKNPGATNVLRSGNKAAAVLTLLLDGVKGWVPMALVMWFGKDYGMREGTLAAVGLAAFVGHLYPVFFGFQGGKGVATAAGVLFGVHWVLGLATLATWIIVAIFSRYSSLASIACAIFAPWYYLVGDRSFWYVDKLMAVAIVTMSAFLIFRHRENIIKLLKGTESKLGASRKS
ncbi:glycerol-3-phosphate 1-O-acyltransferase PlsY [Polaromonas sp.]|uniref:glycerol-3-phosphate 1-O-acyltransferase PlsY n=1 Tax=Polaromonas sp. TaxID=1869339 RepID=UPI00326397CE